ncbi:hypothetical protein [Cryobacterium sp. Y50]|uniref:hypothetical protein n=1 Tax=Cryobacterium sp. Y50 TaxID=2048286 RepID=UPI001304B58E|nr:hypothetical protein [Cryobacterium sp. Y50]
MSRSDVELVRDALDHIDVLNRPLSSSAPPTAPRGACSWVGPTLMTGITSWAGYPV